MRRPLSLAVVLGVVWATPALAAPQINFTTAPGKGNTPANATLQNTDDFFELETVTDPGDPQTSVMCRVDGGPLSNCIGGFYTAPGAPFADGNHTVQVELTTALTGITTFSYTWLVDTVPPTVSGLPDASNTTAQISHYPLFAVVPDITCADNPGGSGLDICEPRPNTYDTSALGTYEDEYTAIDFAGNETTYIRDYRVEPLPYSSLVLGDSPTGYWKFNDPLSSLWTTEDGANDSAPGSVYDGTYFNEVTVGGQAAPACERRPYPPWACSIFPPAKPQTNSASFDGGDGAGYVRANVPRYRFAYTIEAAVRPSDLAERAIAELASDFLMATTSDEHYVCARGARRAVGGTVEPGVWAHVACRFTGSRLQLFVDGSLEASVAAPTVGVSGTANLYMGRADALGTAFKGLIDEVAYYDHQVSDLRLAARWDHIDLDESFYVLSEAPGRDVTPPTLINVAVPAENAQFSVDAQAAHQPHAAFTCADPGAPLTPLTGGNCVGEYSPDGTTWTEIAPGGALPLAADTRYLFRVRATSPSGLVYTTPPTPYFVHGPAGAGFAKLISCTAVAAPAGGPWAVPACVTPTAYWRLDEASSATTLQDTVGDNDGTFRNDSASGGVGISGDGNSTRAFLGDGGYAEVQDIVEPEHGYTIEAWVRPLAVESMWIAEHGSTAELYISGGRYAFRPEEREAVLYGPGGGPTAPAANQWAHVVGTWDGIYARLYVNGSKVASLRTQRWPNGTDAFYLGRGDGEAGVGTLKGTLDEVAYYPAALAAASVLQHFEADPPAPTADPASAPQPGTAPGSVGAAGKQAKAKAKAKAKKLLPVVCAKRKKGVSRCTVKVAHRATRVVVMAKGKRLMTRKLKAGRGVVRVRTKAGKATFVARDKRGRVVRRAVVKLR